MKTNKEFIQQLITDVHKHCNDNNISIRQFLIGLGQNGIVNYQTLLNCSTDRGQLGLVLTLLNFFNYGKK